MSIALDHYVRLGFLINLHKSFTVNGVTGYSLKNADILGTLSNTKPVTLIQTPDFIVSANSKATTRDGDCCDALYLTVLQGNYRVVGLLPYRPTNESQQLLAMAVCDSYLKYVTEGNWVSVTNQFNLAGSAKRHIKLNESIQHVLTTDIDRLMEHYGPASVRHSLDKVVSKYRKTINRNGALGRRRA